MVQTVLGFHLQTWVGSYRNSDLPEYSGNLRTSCNAVVTQFEKLEDKKSTILRFNKHNRSIEQTKQQNNTLLSY